MTSKAKKWAIDLLPSREISTSRGWVRNPKWDEALASLPNTPDVARRYLEELAKTIVTPGVWSGSAQERAEEILAVMPPGVSSWWIYHLAYTDAVRKRAASRMAQKVRARQEAHAREMQRVIISEIRGMSDTSQEGLGGIYLGKVHRKADHELLDWDKIQTYAASRGLRVVARDPKAHHSAPDDLGWRYYTQLIQGWSPRRAMSSEEGGWTATHRR